MLKFNPFFEENNITDHEDCGCEDNTDCCEGHGDEDFLEGETTITMSDSDGNEYEFILHDEVQLDDETYLLMITPDDEEPELVIVRVAVDRDGNDTLVSVDEDEFDRVFEEYERLCEEEEEDEEE